MKKILVLLLIGALGVPSSSLFAQAPVAIPTPTTQDLPPGMEPAAPVTGATESTLDAAEDLPPSTGDLLPEPVEGEASQAPFGLFERGDISRSYQCDPALLESTGTWLRRGFWSAEVDITLMDRIWRRDALDLIGEVVGTGITGNPITNGSLTVDGGISGAEATPRLKLSRFLFRDHLNRDHNMEFVVFGGGQWNQNARLDARSGGSFTTLVGGAAHSDFDGATSSQYSYDNRFNSVELNYHVKARMMRDRMELEPSGQWVRRAQPTNTRSLLAGIRYFDVTENMNWSAFGIPDANADGFTEQGNYNVRSDNDMFGAQAGISWTHERARWSLGFQSKGGIFWNHTDIDSAFSVSNVVDSDVDIEVDNLSFVVDGAVIGRWHLRPNMSIRAGVEILYVSSIAHAAEQLTFIPVSTSQTAATGDSTYMGGTFGIEGYW